MACTRCLFVTPFARIKSFLILKVLWYLSACPSHYRTVELYLLYGLWLNKWVSLLTLLFCYTSLYFLSSNNKCAEFPVCLQEKVACAFSQEWNNSKSFQSFLHTWAYIVSDSRFYINSTDSIGSFLLLGCFSWNNKFCAQLCIFWGPFSFYIIFVLSLSCTIIE